MGLRSVSEEDWVLDASIPETRRRILYENIDANILADRILNSSEMNDCRVEKGTEVGLRDFERARAMFNIIDIHLLDMFMSGISGYRAQYYLSPEEGTSYNSICLRKFLPPILSGLMDRTETATESLKSPHAKMWVTNEEIAFNGPGSRKLTVRVSGNQIMSCANLASPHWKIPDVARSQLLVLGGFVEKSTHNYGVSDHKRMRSIELHLRGQS